MAILRVFGNAVTHELPSRSIFDVFDDISSYFDFTTKADQKV